jgi:hypothetical protein
MWGVKRPTCSSGELLVCDLVLAVEERAVNGRGIEGRPCPASSQLSRLELKHMKQHPAKGKNGGAKCAQKTTN